MTKSPRETMMHGSWLKTLYLNLNLGGLFRGVPFMAGVGVKFPHLKLIRIMVKNWNLVRKYTNIWSFTNVASENKPYSTKTPLTLLMSAFFCKKSAFLNIHFCFRIIDHSSRIWLPDCSKSIKDQKNDNDIIFQQDSIVF